MVLVNLHMKAVLCTLANGEMANSMVTVMRFGPMAQSISGSTVMAERRDSAFSGGLMDQAIQANGSQIRFMATGPINGQITAPTSVGVLMGESTVLGATNGLMVVNMRVNIKTI